MQRGKVDLLMSDTIHCELLLVDRVSGGTNDSGLDTMLSFRKELKLDIRVEKTLSITRNHHFAQIPTVDDTDEKCQSMGIIAQCEGDVSTFRWKFGWREFAGSILEKSL